MSLDFTWKQARAVVLSALAAGSFGSQQVLQRLNDDRGVGSANIVLSVTLACALLVLFISCDMYLSRDKQAANWYQRYKGTPGMLALQLAVLACFWIFNFDIIGLFFFWGCSICKSMGTNAIGKVIYKYFFWFHVGACFPIAVLGPLQFFERVRKSRSFVFHRWFGKILLLDSLVHQGCVSALVTMGMLNSKNWDGWLYYSALAVLNLYAWVAIIIGWPAAIRKDIPTHGAYMHRLGAMWFAIVTAFRVFRPFARAIHEDWEDSIAGWATVFFCIGTVEIYLRMSGRFDSVAPLPQARCPLAQSP